MEKAIGGYFELELPPEKNYPYSHAYHYQSARASFYALLEVIKPSKVWMPRYICHTMIAPLKALSIEYDFYAVGKDLSCGFEQDLKADELLLYVNYFGVCQQHKQSLLKRYPANQIVFDHSQAFFDKAQDGLATIYSPRKFFGVPDGGLLVTELSMPEVEDVDNTSLKRAQHLLLRLDQTPEAGYDQYRNSEAMLRESLKPLKMSNLTRKILKSIDFEKIAEIRQANFGYLHQRLAQFNEIKIASSGLVAPLSYPFLFKADGLRNKLIAERIFIPKYWPDAEERCRHYQNEKYLINNLIPLACDQRYNIDDMGRIVGIIQKFKA